jgi:hypothetical protein
MELRGENIIARDGRGKGVGVAGGGGRERRLRGLAVVAVHEVEARAVGDAPPERVRARLPDLVPAHVRNLQARGAPLGREAESDDAARQQPEARRVALFARLEEHLQPDAKPEEGFRCGGLPDRFPQPVLVERAHAVGHCALAGEHHAVGAANGGGIGGDLDLGLGRDVQQRLLHRAQVAHSVVDDGDALRHRREARSGPRALPWWKVWRRPRADRAPPPCAARARKP